MIKIEIIFSLQDAIGFFRGNGFKVEFQDMEVDFTDHYGKIYTETVKTWVVYNPYTDKPEFIEPVFKKHLDRKKKNLFLDDSNKLDLYNLFDKTT
ncbi:MAG: hypothetical protein FWF54_07365 [Candidatus Azobacteroides sp.]|nr:hypothetical protein [Candidatus Azobacteroides sp.]